MQGTASPIVVLAALAVVVLAAAPCAAEPPARPPKPYRTVAVTLPPASGDASFDAFRRALGAVAKGRIYAELARLIEPQGFFWERDFANGFDVRKPAVDNLAAAIRLERGDGIGWDALAAFAALAAAEPLPSRPGVVCAPARPAYDGIAYARLLDETNTGDLEWAYPRADGAPVRSAPQPDAAATGRLGLHFVRRLGFERPAGEAAPEPRLWTRVATPAGHVGFVAPGSLMALSDERLCYGKDAIGRWHIAGFITGVN
jgi:hypothetical protein